MSRRGVFFVLAVGLVAGAHSQPIVTAESALVIEATSGKVLFSKDPDASRYPASTTKIMTALLLAERAAPETMIEAPRDVEGVTGSSLHLRPFERVSAEDLLHALLLRSANDAAYTVAEYIGGSQEGFAELMNARAKEIGCTGTHFVNPHGLHDPDHYTTASDLAMIARAAMKNARFAQAAGAVSKTISRSANEEDVFIKTHNRFLESRPDATGVKTGWTVPAGRCFVGSAERDGLSVITVVLKGTDWLGDSDLLANWAFENWSSATLATKGAYITSAWVGEAGSLQLKLAPAGDVKTALRKGGDAHYRVVSTDVHAGENVRKGDEVGTVTVTDTDGFETTVAVVALNGFEEKRDEGTQPLGYGIAIALIGGAWFMRRKVRRGL